MLAGQIFLSTNFHRTDHTYENLTCAETSEKQVTPSCIKQQWRNLEDFAVFDATASVKMFDKLMLERRCHANAVDREFFGGKIFPQLNFRLALFSLL